MKKINIIVITLIILIGCIFLYLDIKDMKKTKDPKKKQEPTYTDNFNIKLIKEINKNNKDEFLISPYSIETALNMLREGSNNNTYDEINNALGNNKIKIINNENVKIANGIFIKNQYKNNVKKTFLDKIKSDYNGEIIYDDFNTPTVINEWVNKNTDGMIPKLLDDINKDYIMGISNAIAIDVKWYKQFECIRTNKAVFTKEDNSKIDVEMMRDYADSQYMSYFENDKSKGVTIDYKNNNLEFIGILPKTNIDDYINNMNYDDLYNLETIKASEKVHIILSLPRFSYSYDLSNFKEILEGLGIKEVFIDGTADLSNMIDVPSYVSTAIHKTYIDLNEKGTKAAAVTYFGVESATATLPEDDYKEYKIEFNKPFIYMIKDKSTNQILFFGTVKEPNIWKGPIC